MSKTWSRSTQASPTQHRLQDDVLPGRSGVRESGCPGGLAAYALVLAAAAFAGYQVHGAAEELLAQHAALVAPDPMPASGARVALSDPQPAEEGTR